jgi:hypothetical protein
MLLISILYFNWYLFKEVGVIVGTKIKKIRTNNKTIIPGPLTNNVNQKKIIHLDLIKFLYYEGEAWNYNYLFRYGYLTGCAGNCM